MEKEKKEHPEHHEHHEHHDLKIDNDPDKIISKFGTKMKKNLWMPVSFVLGIVVIILLIVMIIGTGGVGKGVAEKNLIEFATSQGLDATVVNTVVGGSYYIINLSIQGQESFPVWVSNDGKLMATQVIPLTVSGTGGTTAPTDENPVNIPKENKPVVDLYIFSYCPFGTQAEKGMQPVYDLLKNKVDFNVIAIGAMHGEYERVESLRQICVEKNYGKDKLWKYLKAFNENSAVGACGGTAACVDPLIEKIYTTLTIDKTKINTCMEKDAPALYDAQGAKASGLGFSGSPTIVINGVEIPTTSDYKYYFYNDEKIPFSRDAETYKTIVCSLFNNEPSECSQTLSTASPSAGFGATAGAAATGAQC